MKKILYSIIAFSILFISCSKDENSETPLTEESIVGTWNLTELYSENTKLTATTSIGVPVNADVIITSKDYMNATTTFSSDPNESFSEGSFVLVTEISALGQNQSNEQTITGDPTMKSDWSLTGNTLNFTLQNGVTSNEVNAEVIVFNESTLKLKVPISEDIDLPSNALGVTISNANITGELFITYSK